MRKMLLIAAALAAMTVTIETKPAQAYPYGGTYWNAFLCGMVYRAAGKFFDGAEDMCWSAYYGN